MRDVVLYSLLSLDGVAEEPGDWMFDADETVFENLAAVIATQDDVLLGRGTYDYWAGYWPTSDVQPFADFINGTPKHVFTSSPLPARGWNAAVPVDGPAAPYVAELKGRAGGDIGIHGSIELARSLLAAGLVDELRLVVCPALAGRGRTLFAPGELRRLTLRDARPSPGGHLFLTYRVSPA